MTKLVQIQPERERNGYDDSDFFVAVLDLKTGKVDYSHMVGSTRFAGGMRYDCIVTPSDLDPEERAVFEGLLWGHCVAMAESREQNRVMRPGPLMAAWTPPAGARVMLREPVRNRNRASEPCRKCSGSGKWTNPRNERDQRSCFGCSGSGARSVLAKGMRTIPAGTVGTVQNSSERRSKFGTYSYGATARIVTDDGQEFNAATSALRLAEEPDMKRAREHAERMFREFTSWQCHVTGRAA